MPTLEEILSVLSQKKDDLAEEFGVSSIGVFGSFARGEQREDSDVDILVDFSKPLGFIRFSSLEQRLKDLLGVCRVDLVTQKALKPYIGRRILDEVRYV